MFFKNQLIFVFLRFLLIGLYFGLARIPCKLISRLTKNNVIVYNIISFAYWLAFGAMFAWGCVAIYNYSFCWFGLLGMLFGIILVEISINFFFTNLFLLLYNKFKKRFSREKEYGTKQSA